MSTPNRPKRPSARPTTRPEQVLNVTVTGLHENTPPAGKAPTTAPKNEAHNEMPAAGAKSNDRPPRVSARRSAPHSSVAAPPVPAPVPAKDAAKKSPPRDAKKKSKSVHTAQTVVPKNEASARRARNSGAKNAAEVAPTRDANTRAGEVGPAREPAPVLPAAAESAAAPAQGTAAQTSPTLRAPTAAAADDSRGVSPATERPSKGRASRASRPEVALADAHQQPGVHAVEGDETWNDEAAPAALGAFDSADGVHGLTREINAARLLRAGQHDAAHEVAERSAAQSILATDYYARQYGAHGLRSLAVDVDEFGFDPYVEERARKPLERLVERYFRVSVEGMERVPAEGRALFVVNRAGALPWDALVLRTVLRTHRPELPSLRWLAEDDVIHYPFLGVFMNRLGAVRACPENAERLLERDRLVAVFPEGAQGSRKPYGERYRLQRFGRGGYIRLALKLGVPIFPTAVVGAEDVQPMLGRSRLLGRIFGTDTLPLTPTFPWLGVLGLIPAPVKWRIVVGEPVDLTGYGPKAADDALVVHRLNEQVRAILQGLVDSARTKRGHALFR